MEESFPFEGGVTLYDISLHKKGPLEDKLYIHKDFYLLNIRRGNSILNYNDQKTFCRRGMKKFYDLDK